MPRKGFILRHEPCSSSVTSSTRIVAPGPGPQFLEKKPKDVSGWGHRAATDASSKEKRCIRQNSDMKLGDRRLANKKASETNFAMSRNIAGPASPKTTRNMTWVLLFLGFPCRPLSAGRETPKSVPGPSPVCLHYKSALLTRRFNSFSSQIINLLFAQLSSRHHLKS